MLLYILIVGTMAKLKYEKISYWSLARWPVQKFAVLLYVQEVVALRKKYLIYLHQKMRFTPFINYYDTLG